MIVFTIISIFLAAECMQQVTSYQCNGSMESFTIDLYKNHCYLIGHKKRSFGDAYKLCELYGGHLTDIPEDELRNVTNQSKSIHQYWVGLIWTEALDTWIWITGVKRKLSIADRGFFGSYCASYHVGNDRSFVEETSCKTKLNPICKFTVTNNDVDGGCFDMCSKINEKQPDVDTDLNNNDTSGAMFNETMNVTTTSNMTDEVCDCKQPSQFINDEIITTLTLILGAVLLVSFVVNILTVCQIVCKCRKARAKRASSQKNRISLIDILNVGGGDFSSGDTQTYEKMNYDDDNTASQGPKRVPKSANGAKNVLNDAGGNARGYDGLAKDKDLKVPSIHCTEVESLNDQSCEYSALDRTGRPTNLASDDPSHVYGIDSGSVHSLLDGLKDGENKETSDVENTEPLNIYSNVGSDDI